MILAWKKQVNIEVIQHLREKNITNDVDLLLELNHFIELKLSPHKGINILNKRLRRTLRFFTK